MRKDRFSVNALHGDMEQKDRIKTLNDYKAGLFTFIVATDVAARGIQVGGVTQVIHYDVSMEAEAYVHRIVRMGRAGNEGEAITFVTPRDEKFLSAIEEYIEMKILVVDPPTLQEVEKNNGKVISTKKVVKAKNEKNLKVNLSAGKKKKLRRGDIVGKFVKCRLPVTLKYSEQYDTKEEAMKRERRIKKLKREDNLKLFENKQHGQS